MKTLVHRNSLKAVGLIGIVILMLTACGGNKATGEKENQIVELINNREFEIENRWANPLGSNMINLLGNPNYIRVKGDSLDIFLPYFGVRHTGGGYGSEGGIKYKGPARNFTVNHEEGKDRYIIKFEANQDTEILGFMIIIYPNGETNTSVNSSQRNSISYRGEVLPLTEE